LEKKVIQILLIVCLVFTLVLGSCTPKQSENPVPEPIEPTEPSLPSELFLDSDGDGFNDWFEMNIAHYDPSIPNDRYFILFYRVMDALEYDPEGTIESRGLDLPIQFLTEKGNVPSENIIRLTQEEATTSALKNTIEQVAKKSDENDLVYVQISAHGNGSGSTLTTVSFLADKWIKYTTFNEWLDQIEAKAVILTISSCGCEKAVSVLKKGSCPRVIYLYGNYMFIKTLGAKLDCAEIADNRYGNNDGYVSIGEMADYQDDEFNYQSDWNILRKRRKMRKDPKWISQETIEVEGYYPSRMIDASNIAYQIYLTDYKIPN